MLLKKYPERTEFLGLAKMFNVVPLCAEILADVETPVSILQKFQESGNEKGPLFLLESVEGGEHWGRYSFLGVRAYEEVKIYRDYVEILSKKREGEDEERWIQRVNHGGDPLAVLRKYMSRFKAVSFTELPRFFGGLVGYFAYEMVSFIENVPNYLPPEVPVAHLMLPEQMVIFDNLRQSMTCVQLVFFEETSGLQNTQDVIHAFKNGNEKLQELVKRVQKCEGDHTEGKKLSRKKVRDLELRPKYSENEYRKKVNEAKTHIMAGDVIQVVVAQPFLCDAPEDTVALYRAQRYVNPSPYLYYVLLDGRCMIGSSPETMVKLERGTAWVRPIAGTRPRGKMPKEDRQMADELLKSEKERAEHLMLVDLGRNDLGRVAAPGSVRVTDLMFVERYSHVMHLVSNVTCELSAECDVWDLFKAVFPAGTLSGAPKVPAMKIIAELEKESRGFYGGAVGYVSFTGDMDLAITIRTACVEKEKLFVYAGAGIVADSVPAEEYRETINKAKSVEMALNFVEKWEAEKDSYEEDKNLN
ncbi:MAG: chorismate-binding protein [Planctomycetia bacterium]|nr:chorismate-binding protein [Planctomycetia bacterium]